MKQNPEILKFRLELTRTGKRAMEHLSLFYFNLLIKKGSLLKEKIIFSKLFLWLRKSDYLIKIC